MRSSLNRAVEATLLKRALKDKDILETLGLNVEIGKTILRPRMGYLGIAVYWFYQNDYRALFYEYEQREYRRVFLLSRQHKTLSESILDLTHDPLLALIAEKLEREEKMPLLQQEIGGR